MDKQNKTSLTQREVELVSLAVSATVKELLPFLSKNEEKKACQCSKEPKQKTFEENAKSVEKETDEIKKILKEIDDYTNKLFVLTRRFRDPARFLFDALV